jgi:hypothetical protein
MASFGFGQPSSSGTPNTPLFGGGNNTSGGTTPSLFGGATNTATPASTGGGSMFGGGSNTGASNPFGGGASNTPASKPGGIFGGGGATSGAPGTGLFGGSGMSKPAGEAPKSLFSGGFGNAQSGNTSATPSFGFNNPACKCPIQHSLRTLANNEPQHPHPPPRPRPPRRPTTSSPRRHLQALLQAPVSSAVRTTSLAETIRLATRCLGRSRKHLEAPRVARHCLADRTTRPVEARNPARLSSVQSQQLLHLRPPLTSSAALREESRWAARRLRHCLVGTKTHLLAQTKPRPQHPPHQQTSLAEELSLAHHHRYSAVNKTQHPPAKLPASVSAQHQHPQAPRSLLPAWAASA